jgi:hypothetical protein
VSKYPRWVEEGPRWFDWARWGLALGSDKRYKPKWWERRAYIMGIRDAARIVEHERYQPHPDKPRSRMVLTPGSSELRLAVRTLHAYVRNFLGLPPDHRSGLE